MPNFKSFTVILPILLLCRACTFLPIASHIGNFASMLYGAKRILSVKFPHSASPYSDVWNWSYCFNRCFNVQYIFGFEDVNFKDTAILNGLFEGCNSLTDTDFKYPAGITEITTTFAQCYKLQKNLAEFFPKYGFTSSAIKITAPFYSCNSATLNDVTGATPVDKVLWNSETTKWIVVPWKIGSDDWLPFSSAFTNANGVNNVYIKSTIPESWGGKNTSIDVQLAITDEMKADYTAFEVYPTDHDIPKGSSELGEAIWNDPTITTNFNVVASMTEEFSLWITKSRLESDIIIDWGDGTVEKLSELTPTSGTANDGQIDVLVYVAHTYETPNKRYIVKVYGNDYCRLDHRNTKLNSANRLLCRCFTDDLPVSRHLNNLASFAYSSNRLVKVDIPSYSDLFTHVVNWSSTFNACYNLRYCYGFGNMFQSVYSIDNIVNGCSGLLDTDIKMRSMLFNGTSSSFNGCTNLERNVLDFFGSKLNVGTSPFSVQNLFRNCAKIHLGVSNAEYEAELKKFNNGEENTLTAMKATMDANAIKLGNLLWNNKNIVWNQLSSDGKGPFSGCSAVLKSYVPISWGGTNTSIDAQLAITDEMKADYTAFEVYPTDHIILSGSTEIGEEVWGDNTLTVTNEIPSSITEEFSLWITKSRLESDIVIDWGDGVIEKLSELEPTNGKDNDGKIDVLVYVAHTYTVPNKKYIVKVYGKDYCRLSHLTFLNTNNRLVCRVFDNDLPVASHLTNLASYCLHCVRLLKVSISSFSDMLLHVVNLASLFEGCNNLMYAYGFDNITKDIVPGGVNNVFRLCNGLLKTDFKIPATFVSARNLFYNCKRLNINIANVFSNGSLSMLQLIQLVCLLVQRNYLEWFLLKNCGTTQMSLGRHIVQMNLVVVNHSLGVQMKFVFKYLFHGVVLLLMILLKNS